MWFYEADDAGGLLGDYQLRKYINSEQNFWELFETIIWERSKQFFVVFLLGTLAFRKWSIRLVPPILLLGLGAYAGLCISCQGFMGLGLFFLSLFPQLILYCLVIYVLLHKKKPIHYSGKRYILTEMVSVFLLFILILLGCFLEATVSNFLLKNYLLAFISAIS